MYFVKVTFVDGGVEIHKVSISDVLWDLPQNDIELNSLVLIHVLSFLSKGKVTPIVSKIEFVDPQ